MKVLLETNAFRFSLKYATQTTWLTLRRIKKAILISKRLQIKTRHVVLFLNIRHIIASTKRPYPCRNTRKKVNVKIMENNSPKTRQPLCRQAEDGNAPQYAIKSNPQGKYLVSSTVTFGYCQFPIYFIYAIRERYAPTKSLIGNPFLGKSYWLLSKRPDTPTAETPHHPGSALENRGSESR